MHTTAEAGTERRILADGVELPVSLVVPARALGLCVFAHGSSSRRHGPRTRRIAEHLHARGVATLRLDLMTTAEAEADLEGGCQRFDVHALARRLVAVTDQVHHLPGLFGLPLAYLGVDTGAAAALIAAARRPALVAAVVAHEGRVELAGPSLSRVRAPVLLIVGDGDPELLALTRTAARALTAPHQLVVVPASAPELARRAGDWLVAGFAAAPVSSDASRATPASR